MVKLPQNPPSIEELQAIGPETRKVATKSLLLRVYFRGGDYPSVWNEFRNYGPVNARFDHHPEPPDVYPNYGIYYAAQALTTCLAEVFQDMRTINTVRRQPWVCTFEIGRDLELLDLTGSWPTRAGASMKINSGPRASSRAWSRQFYNAFPDMDGIYYCSSMHANEPSFALYERASDALPAVPMDDRPLQDRLLLGDLKRASKALNYNLVTS